MSNTLVASTESWDESAQALMRTAQEGPTKIVNKVFLEMMNHASPFDASTAILDTGCGVGQVLGSLLEMYGSEIPSDAKLMAADLSPGMIAALNSRKSSEISAGNAIWNRVETKTWDAQDLISAGVPDETFSHVTAGLVFLMVPRPADALAETRRVLKSNGGVFGMTSFRSIGWMDIISDALHEVKPGTRLPPIPQQWASSRLMKEQMEEAGFRHVVSEEVETFYEFDDADAMTRFNVANIPSVKSVTADMSQDEVDKAIQLMLKWLGDRFPGGKGKLRGTAIVTIGRK